MIYANINDSVKKTPNFWNHIHFHPTDAIEDDWGKEILDKIAEERAAKTVRVYAMLEDIVSRNENGGFNYDFSLNDQRLEYLLSKGFDIFLSYNFIPPCIATDPQMGSSVSKNKTRYKGKMICVSPPADYGEWEEICYQYTKHIVEHFGTETVKKWHLQCYNEPDLYQFFMRDVPRGDAGVPDRLREYLKLYKGFANAVCRVDSGLKIGGPSCASRLLFLEGFLKEIKSSGTKLDFVSIHTYGTTPKSIEDGSWPFNAENTLRKHKAHLEIIDKYFPDAEVIVDEWGASTRGFANMEDCPQLLFRERSGFAAYFGKMITAYIRDSVRVSKMLICLSGQHEMVIDFSGFRNFFTLNKIRKPIYNAYVLTGKLYENVLLCKTDDTTSALVTERDGKIAAMVCYAAKNFDKRLPDFSDILEIDGLNGKKTVTVYVIDRDNMNPYEYSKQYKTDTFSPAQLEILKKEGMLKPVKKYEENAEGKLQIPLNSTDEALIFVTVE